MKIIIAIISLFFTNSAYAAQLYPFGDSIFDEHNEPIVIAVCVTLIDNNDKAIPPTVLYSGYLHKSKHKGFVGAVVIDSFVQRSLMEDNSVIQKLRSFDVFGPGKYEVFYRTYSDTDYSDPLEGYIRQPSAIVEVRDYYPPPVVDPSQLVVAFSDIVPQLINRIISNANGIPVTIQLSDLQVP